MSSARIFCDIKLNINGLYKLPTSNNIPYVVISNHQSFFDNFFMSLFLPTHSWVIKRELLNIPLFGSLLRITSPIAVNRSSDFSIRQILREGTKKLDSNISLLIFPEATRVSTKKNLPFKPSAIKLAMDNNVPLVLVAHNAGFFWPKGFWLLNSGTINVKIIDVIYPHQYSKFDVRSLTTKTQQIINDAKDELAGNVYLH